MLPAESYFSVPVHTHESRKDQKLKMKCFNTHGSVFLTTPHKYSIQYGGFFQQSLRARDAIGL